MAPPSEPVSGGCVPWQRLLLTGERTIPCGWTRGWETETGWGLLERIGLRGDRELPFGPERKEYRTEEDGRRGLATGKSHELVVARGRKNSG